MAADALWIHSDNYLGDISLVNMLLSNLLATTNTSNNVRFLCCWNLAAMGHSPLSALLEKIDSPKIVNFDIGQWQDESNKSQIQMPSCFVDFWQAVVEISQVLCWLLILVYFYGSANWPKKDNNICCENKHVGWEVTHPEGLQHLTKFENVHGHWIVLQLIEKIT
jgi:hypothetical protein